LFNKHKFFIQRDIRKEGITKPRELLKAILEVLNKKYPKIEIFSFTDFYDSFSLRVNDEVFFPKRGHGLGMANSLTTLMQLGVHNMIVNRLSNDIPEISADCLCLNDDFVVGFSDDYHKDEYWDMEDVVMDQLSILRAQEKSFESEYKFVIAERYITDSGEYKKESYQRRELLYPLTCYNIVHAKEYFISAQSYTSYKYRDDYIGEIMSYWGYEFFPNEINFPAKLGGWINDKINGVDMTLVISDRLEYNCFFAKVFFAARQSYKRRRKGDLYQSPIFSLYGEPVIP